MATIHNHDLIPQDISPEASLKLLKRGNFRFVNNLKLNRDLLEQVNETKDGQWPFAAILSCMDSRTSSELIFDLGLGDIFSIRIAGQVVTDDILGCLEFATAVSGSKLILVLGHTNCGAIKGACDNVKLGNLTSVLKHIHPAIAAETTTTENRHGENYDFVTKVARLNVIHSVHEIINRSPIIKKMVDEGTVGIVPAMYDVATGGVTFYDNEGFMRKGEAEEHKMLMQA